MWFESCHENKVTGGAALIGETGKRMTGKKEKMYLQRKNRGIKRDESENKQAKEGESQDKYRRAVNKEKWVKVNERRKQKNT